MRGGKRCVELLSYVGTTSKYTTRLLSHVPGRGKEVVAVAAVATVNSNVMNSGSRAAFYSNGVVGVYTSTVNNGQRGTIQARLNKNTVFGGYRRWMSSLPDHERLSMPALSPTMSQGNIVAWKKKEGDSVQPGDIYCEVETDKATIEWEAQEEGFLAKILKGDGSQNIDVGVPVAILVESEDDIAAFASYTGGDEAPAAAPAAPASTNAAASSFPAHDVMSMPALSPTMSEGTLLKWKKAVGDEIAAGDVLAEIETDKATMEWEAQEDGILAQILVAEGTSGISVGSPVFIQVDSADSVDAFKSFTIADASGAAPASEPVVAEPAAPKAPTPTAAATTAKKAPTTPSTPMKTVSSTGGRVVASPYARKLAAENNVSLAGLQGSGPGGRIVAADVLGAPAGGAAVSTGAFDDIATTGIRRIIAQRLLESKQQIPHYYLTASCRIDTLSALRAKLNQSLAASDSGKISMNDFVIKASAMALKKVPEANASWHGDFIRQYNMVHCSVAVQTPAGLMVPVVRNADKKGLAAIAADVKSLAAKAREGKLGPEESADGTFTVSNLGMFGVTQFSAIVNPPQACILAVGSAEKKVVPSSTGEGFEEGTFVTVTLSCDHRVIDGAVGAQWLQAFKGYLEDPASMLL
jgi:pyruvate dehydrogenase E2 component (dihydrolipoamide acetyltransferase)